MSAIPEPEHASQSEERAVIVEIAADGSAKIRGCPPGVVAMLVADRQDLPEEGGSEEPPQRKRSIGAGRRDGSPPRLATPEDRGEVEVREIPVEFPR